MKNLKILMLLCLTSLSSVALADHGYMLRASNVDNSIVMTTLVDQGDTVEDNYSICRQMRRDMLEAFKDLGVHYITCTREGLIPFKL